MSMAIDDANHDDVDDDGNDDNDDDDDNDGEQPHCQRLYDQLDQASYFPPLHL